MADLVPLELNMLCHNQQNVEVKVQTDLIDYSQTSVSRDFSHLLGRLFFPHSSTFSKIPVLNHLRTSFSHYLVSSYLSYLLRLPQDLPHRHVQSSLHKFR